MTCLAVNGMSTPDIFLALFVFVFYLPRGIPHICITLMYIHLNSNADTATQSIAADVCHWGRFSLTNFYQRALVLPGIWSV